MKKSVEKERRFLAVTNEYKEVIAKVCLLYSSSVAPFEDLYQEVLINLWQGLDTFRGDAKISTWIYRTALNTCITWHRSSSRHNPKASLTIDNLLFEPATSDEAGSMIEEAKELYRLISRLGPIDKALITLWLNEKPYDEIARITGLSQSNVAVRIHRIKEKLTKMAEDPQTV